ncbi:MAG TPA: chemotaxis protein CheB, partial [Burkholderiaceae bacterium]|nr:chemotaxis protein CheB [Burkholderiaceae bacterium]
VMHVHAEARSDLAEILDRAGPLPAVRAEDGMALLPGRIHVAPPNQHLLVERGRVRVVHGPRENRHRPAIDPLFRSAAWIYGPRVVGVVLTGNLDDGTAGLWAIKTCGGTTVVQEPTTARQPEMPLNALMHNRIDHRVSLEGIGALLVRLASEPVDVHAAPRPPPSIKDEIEFAKMNPDIVRTQRMGHPSPYTCPACGGALWELEEGGHLRYRCHTGHAYSQASLLLDQDQMVEESLFSALRAVDEKAVALRRLAERWHGPDSSIKEGYEERALEMDHTAAVLRTLLSGQVRTPYVPGIEPEPEPGPPA